jgi:Uma2 family endonuclease
MATTLHVPIEEYLKTSYEYDREFVDGEVVERVLPTYLHGKTVSSFSFILKGAGLKHRLFVCSDTRMRVSPSRVRLPDVAVFAGTEPAEAVPSSPPLIVVEILSPSDPWSEVISRSHEFQDWGVRHIWLADPQRRELFIFAGGDVRAAQKLELSDYGIAIRPEDVF